MTANSMPPIVTRAEELTVVFTRRTVHLKHHSGQISFPGGRAEDRDAGAEDTALREAREEIGLDLARVEVLGRLPEYHTRTDFRVTPVVALVALYRPGPMELIPEFVALAFSLSIYTAAFIGEIVRAGILGVSHGQTEAAQALGLPRGLVLRLVVVPQALRIIVPPLTSQYLNLTKNSSLAAAIAYPDLVLVFAGTVLMQTGQAVEIIAVTMAVYLTISLLISLGMNLYNRRIALVDR